MVGKSTNVKTWTFPYAGGALEVRFISQELLPSRIIISELNSHFLPEKVFFLPVKRLDDLISALNEIRGEL